jgi:hypothetical protein
VSGFDHFLLSAPASGGSRRRFYDRPVDREHVSRAQVAA